MVVVLHVLENNNYDSLQSKLLTTFSHVIECIYCICTPFQEVGVVEKILNSTLFFLNKFVR